MVSILSLLVRERPLTSGPNMDELYVTSAAAETAELAQRHPHSGHLFVVKGLGYKGTERTRFKGKFHGK